MQQQVIFLVEFEHLEIDGWEIGSFLLLYGWCNIRNNHLNLSPPRITNYIPYVFATYARKDTKWSCLGMVVSTNAAIKQGVMIVNQWLIRT